MGPMGIVLFKFSETAVVLVFVSLQAAAKERKKILIKNRIKNLAHLFIMLLAFFIDHIKKRCPFNLEHLSI
jgi:hypothetical protein